MDVERARALLAPPVDPDLALAVHGARLELDPAYARRVRAGLEAPQTPEEERDFWRRRALSDSWGKRGRMAPPASTVPASHSAARKLDRGY